MTYPQPPEFVVQPALPTSGIAVASMVLGILGAAGGWCVLGIPCLVAILLGHLAWRETKSGRKAGHGMTVAGLLLGYIFAVPWVGLAVLTFIGGVSAPFTGS